jgi:hypothetical protein
MRTNSYRETRKHTMQTRAIISHNTHVQVFKGGNGIGLDNPELRLIIDMVPGFAQLRNRLKLFPVSFRLACVQAIVMRFDTDMGRDIEHMNAMSLPCMISMPACIMSVRIQSVWTMSVCMYRIIKLTRKAAGREGACVSELLRPVPWHHSGPADGARDGGHRRSRGRRLQVRPASSVTVLQPCVRAFTAPCAMLTPIADRNHDPIVTDRHCKGAKACADVHAHSQLRMCTHTHS